MKFIKYCSFVLVATLVMFGVIGLSYGYWTDQLDMDVTANYTATVTIDNLEIASNNREDNKLKTNKRKNRGDQKKNPNQEIGDKQEKTEVLEEVVIEDNEIPTSDGKQMEVTEESGDLIEATKQPNEVLTNTNQQTEVTQAPEVVQESINQEMPVSSESPATTEIPVSIEMQESQETPNTSINNTNE